MVGKYVEVLKVHCLHYHNLKNTHQCSALQRGRGSVIYKCFWYDRRTKPCVIRHLLDKTWYFLWQGGRLKIAIHNQYEQQFLERQERIKEEGDE